MTAKQILKLERDLAEVRQLLTELIKLFEKKS